MQKVKTKRFIALLLAILFTFSNFELVFSSEILELENVLPPPRIWRQ